MKNRKSNHKEVVTHTLRLADGLTQLECSKFFKDENNGNFCWLPEKESKICPQNLKQQQQQQQQQQKQQQLTPSKPSTREAEEGGDRCSDSLGLLYRLTYLVSCLVNFRPIRHLITKQNKTKQNNHKSTP